MEFDLAQITSSTYITNLAVTYGGRVLAALVTLVIGLYVVSVINSLIRRMFEKSGVEASLRSFLGSVISILLKILVYITALGVLGVEMTAFIAILGAAGLAIGLALSGTLQNFAGGVIILLFKPYKVGDFIETADYMGTVKDIQIFTTILTTVDNKTVIIPNGPLATGSLINYSTQATRRVDWTFGISYGDDVDTAYAVLRRLITEDERIYKDPEPFMALHTLADSSVNIVVRVWVDATEYWPVYFQMNERVYKEFPAAGLAFPFPQMDVHLQRDS
ncbi:MAG: mechanosensitive ion channel domain-containing protein [Pseudohongiellaceae bacterium]